MAITVSPILRSVPYSRETHGRHMIGRDRKCPQLRWSITFLAHTLSARYLFVVVFAHPPRVLHPCCRALGVDTTRVALEETALVRCIMPLFVGIPRSEAIVDELRTMLSCIDVCRSPQERRCEVFVLFCALSEPLRVV